MVCLFFLTIMHPVYVAAQNTIDFSKINEFTQENHLGEDFETRVGQLIEQGIHINYREIGEWVKQAVCGGVAESKHLVLKLLILSVFYALVEKFSKDTGYGSVTEICFLMMYCYAMVLMFLCFGEISQTVADILQKICDFMRSFLPVYCLCITLSFQLNASGAVYSMILFAIYFVEEILQRLVLPGISAYVVLEVLNYLTKEKRFAGLCRLVYQIFEYVLKFSVSAIVGIQLIQGMVAPMRDVINQNMVAKTVQMIPGVGNILSGGGQMFLCSGIVIKNCVGATALIILLTICAIPFVKLMVLVLLLKFTSAIMEPLGNKRLAGGMNGVANGGVLCLKVMGTCFLMMFLSIALTCSATNFLS